MARTASLRHENRHLGSHILLGLWSLIVLFPLWTMVVNSFKFKLDIYKDPFGLPRKWNFESYASVLRESDFFVYFKNSLFVTVGSIALVLLFGSLASYAIVNWKNAKTRFIYLFFIAGMMLPIKIGSIKLLEMIKALGLLNSLLGLYPIYLAMGLPIAVFVLTEFIRDIPYDLTEAAVIDGASRSRIYAGIIMPVHNRLVQDPRGPHPVGYPRHPSLSDHEPAVHQGPDSGSGKGLTGAQSYSFTFFYGIFDSNEIYRL